MRYFKEALAPELHCSTQEGGKKYNQSMVCKQKIPGKMMLWTNNYRQGAANQQSLTNLCFSMLCSSFIMLKAIPLIKASGDSKTHLFQFCTINVYKLLHKFITLQEYLTVITLFSSNKTQLHCFFFLKKLKVTLHNFSQKAY